MKSHVKNLIATFFDIKGIVHKRFVPTGQTADSEYCCEVLLRMRENVRRRCPELWRLQTQLLYHDNAPSHTSVLIQQFLADQKIAVIPHPPHSPVTSFDFQKMKLKLNGGPFDTIQEIQAESHSVVDRKGLPGSVPKMEETVGPVSTCGRELLRG
jgi:hypothetical protein